MNRVDARMTPAIPGAPVGDIDTPALVLDGEAFERNLELLPAALRGSGARLRPHAKTHKCAEIARHQIERGAVGICCQKVSEAEAFIDAGTGDVLITNEVIGGIKLRRLAQLARRARVGVCVDDGGNVGELSSAAAAAGVVIDVLVEIEAGGNRCGVAAGDAAVQMVLAIRNAPCLRFAGLHAYNGAAQHCRTVAERRAASLFAADQARLTRDALARQGIACEIITGGGTGTCLLDAASGVYNEVQPGSYVFMDVDYGRNEWESLPQFESSLFVLTTVMSTPASDRVIVDAGLKALSVDSGMPLVHGRSGLLYTRPSDEHGILTDETGVRAPALGDKLALIPGHCDPTVNLYDYIVVVRRDRVEAVWPVIARGAVF
jgi:D-serine deaminase-like pyridoxal phosphate-dependent protein